MTNHNQAVKKEKSESNIKETHDLIASAEGALI
jgi:hypothetical protein